MVTLDTSKNLGGVGALLLFIGVFPYINFFGIVDIVGVILLLIALHGFASYYKEKGIFNNAIYGVVAAIVGVVIVAAIGIAIVLPNMTSFLEKLYPSWNGNLSTISSLSGMTPVTSNLTFSDVSSFIAAAIAVIAVLWIFATITAFFIRRSLKQVSSKTSVGLFSTAGLLLLIGAALTIILIGVILMWIVALILAIAFFTMKLPSEQPTTATGENTLTVTELEQLCGDDRETFEALVHAMFLDPRKIEISIEDAVAEAKQFEKAKDFVRARTMYEIAGGLAIYEGDLNKVVEFFSKCEELLPDKKYPILKNPEKALAVAQEYYKKYLKA